MLAQEFFKWWYGRGWLNFFNVIKKRIFETFQAFSTLVLLKTLFAPWRRMISYPGSGIGSHFQAFVDNFISRIVGFSVRLFTLLTVIITVTLLAIVGSVALLLWPLLPVVCVALIIKGLV
ncbi:MAG TPA: hypothetical protein VMR08_03595 [Patescibacteria group bacterium]|jgi:hypothetical protein|nr:hypothetical protein [Patescibacteria group bacterium]